MKSYKIGQENKIQFLFKILEKENLDFIFAHHLNDEARNLSSSIFPEVLELKDFKIGIPKNENRIYVRFEVYQTEILCFCQRNNIDREDKATKNDYLRNKIRIISRQNW